MTIRRRTLIQAGAATLAAGTGLARGQTATRTWPSKPVRLIVGFPPGGGLDGAARILAEQLQVVWGTGHTAYVENKPGGSSIIAANSLLASPRDGHSFLVTMNVTMLLPYLGQKLPFDPVVDLLPVAPITLEQLVLVASPALGAKTFDEVLGKVKANPKGPGFGSFTTGSVAHILGRQIARERNIDLVIAQYRGAAAAVQAVLSGEVGMALSNPGTVQQYVASGKLVPIGVTGSKRSRFFPDVPTFKELGISGMESPAWTGVFAGKGTSPDVIQKMAEDMRKALQAPAVVQKFNAFLQEPGVMSTEEFRGLVNADVEVDGALIRSHQIRLDQ
jgi:tripartite-type tricarboxylate transporter receptor subunit TctC